MLHLLYLLNITELHVAQMIPKDTKGYKRMKTYSIKQYQTYIFKQSAQRQKMVQQSNRLVFPGWLAVS